MDGAVQQQSKEVLISRYVRPATIDDARSLAPRLRPHDRAEIEAFLGVPPEFALPRSVQSCPDCYAIRDPEDEGQALAIFGVDPVPMNPELGIVWMVADDALFTHRTRFLRDCRGWIERFHDRYPLLGNHVDARNEAHLRWLQWAGFRFLRVIPEFGAEARPFIQFARLRT